MNDKPGKVVGLKVEHTNPEDHAKNLAIQLGSAMENEANKKLDAEVYTKEAAKWEKLAEDTAALLERLQERDLLLARGEEVPAISRMDPIMSYSVSDVQSEHTKQVETAERFRADVLRYLDEASEYRTELNRVQRKLMDLR